MPNVNEALARINAAEASAGAEPANEDAVDAPPQVTGDPSVAGSAPADASTPEGPSTTDGSASASPGATIDRDALQAKLTRDREARLSKHEKRRLRREREQLEAQRKELAEKEKSVEADRAKWSGVGKEKSWLETVKAMGRDPREAFEEMRAEALRAGTPEAQIAALEKAWGTRYDTLEQQLKAIRDEREAERKALDEERAERGHQDDFRASIVDPVHADLLIGYDPPQLYHIARGLMDKPQVIAQYAEHLGLDYDDLTDDEGAVTMSGVLRVMSAQHADYNARQEQRRNQRAAPQASEGAPQQAPAPAARKPVTVNGTEERNAGTTIGNDLAASRGGSAVSLKELRASMTRDEWVRYLSQRHP